ncbi:MAG: hypothetical protein KJP07_17695, partial [Desulfatitalea sp.]|nr:hypothetical protein [Desulfatitalea sp.]
RLFEATGRFLKCFNVLNQSRRALAVDFNVWEDHARGSALDLSKLRQTGFEQILDNRHVNGIITSAKTH